MSEPFIPRPWQLPCVDHVIQNPRCAVWVPVGGGKCGIVYMAMDKLSLVEEVYPALIVAPKRVARDTWPNEISKWDEFSYMTISPAIGDEKERIAGLKKYAMFYSINFECIEWLINYFGDKWPFKSIIFDESSRLRGYRSRQGTKRAKALSTRAHQTARFIELTGTPAPKGLINTWGPLHFLDQGQRLGKTFTSFQQRWFRTGYDGFSIEPLPHAQKEIEEKIKDVCLSIDLKDYLDIKKPVENTIYVDLPDSARKLYKDMEKKFFMQIEEHGVEAFNAASKSGKLLQLANGAAYVGETKEWKEVHTVKLEAVESLVEECNSTPLFLVTNFVSDRERLLKNFSEAVDLATDKGFKTFLKGNKMIGLAHPGSLGHGVDGLQYVTNIMAFFGMNWDLELYEQVSGRIGPTRQMQAGFDRNVFVHHIIARNTIDEDVLDRLKTKYSVQDALLNAMKRRKL